MQTVGLFQTFENYLFLQRLMCVVQEGVGGEWSRARDDNWCGDEGRGAAWPQGLPAHAHGRGGWMSFLGWVFEQVEGISNTVNTGELDKTVLSYSSVWAALAYTFRHIKTPTRTNTGASGQKRETCQWLNWPLLYGTPYCPPCWGRFLLQFYLFMTFHKTNNT